MPKVIITPNPMLNPIAVRTLLGELGVFLIQAEETTITCVMSDSQIDRFRNSRGAAHRLDIVPEAPPVVFIGTPEDVAGFEQELSDDEPEPEDPSTAEPPTAA